MPSINAATILLPLARGGAKRRRVVIGNRAVIRRQSQMFVTPP